MKNFIKNIITQTIITNMTIIYALLYSCMIPTISYVAKPLFDQSPITLGIHPFFDGTFIDAARMEQVERFKHTVKQLLLGKKQPDGSFKGYFLFNDSYHNIESLKEIEATITSIADNEIMKQLLEKIKNDFIKISNYYKNSTPGVKAFTTGLIKESCEKRNRLDSSLLTWAKTTPENEDAVFKQEITSFKKFSIFLIDLHNFFNDLTHTCPKAHALFILEQKKLFAIKKLLPTVIQELKNSDLQQTHNNSSNNSSNNNDQIPFNQKSFFNNIKKNNILSIIALENITTETVLKLCLEFLNNESAS